MCAVLIAAVAAGMFLIWHRGSSGSGDRLSAVFVIRLCSAQSPNPACRHQDYTDAQVTAIREILQSSAVAKSLSFNEAVSVTPSGSSQRWTAAAFFLYTVKPEKIETIKALVEGQPGIDDVAFG